MFKVGDKVRCIDNQFKKNRLTIGEVYEIVSVKYSQDIDATYVYLKNDTTAYVESRFEKVTKESEELENTTRYKTNSGKQLFDIFEDDLLTYEQVTGFYLGNTIKYLKRYKQKNGVEDLKKVKVYVDQLIKLEEKQDEI